MCSENKGSDQLCGYSKKSKGLHFKETTVKSGINSKSRTHCSGAVLYT